MSEQKPAARAAGFCLKKEKKKRRKRGLGESLILNIQDNHVRTVNGEKRNCEHLHQFSEGHTRTVGQAPPCTENRPVKKFENNT